MYQKLLSHNPEQIFLVQGFKKDFESYLKNISENISSVEYLSLSRFTKEDAFEVIRFNLERSKNSWLIIYFDVFMSEASQILLKTLEEPTDGIHIVFVTPHPYLVPQTIRSRVRLITSNGESNLEEPDFLSSKKEIQEYIKVFGDENINASVRRAKATIFLDQLEQLFYKEPEKIKIIYDAKDMLFKANMPTKQIVEFVVTMVF